MGATWMNSRGFSSSLGIRGCPCTEGATVRGSFASVAGFLLQLYRVSSGFYEGSVFPYTGYSWMHLGPLRFPVEVLGLWTLRVSVGT